MATAWGMSMQKRVFDVVASAFLLTLALPLLPFIVLAIKLESPGPIFYHARRAGYHFRPLDVLKFRKMHVDASGSPLTIAGDARFTRIGVNEQATAPPSAPTGKGTYVRGIRLSPVDRLCCVRDDR